MKWLFLSFLIGLVPVLTALFRSSPRIIPAACFGCGVGMFLLVPRAWTAPIPWLGWPGPVPGLEVNIIDPFALALILSTRTVRVPKYVTASFAVFCCAALISTVTGYQWVPAIFYVFQLFRAALVFVAISRVCASVPSSAVSLIGGLGAGLVYEATLAVYQYHTGDSRPGGSLGHSNFLGLASEFVVPPTTALLFGTRRLFWPAIVLSAGFAIAIVGGSRATLGLYGIGLVLTWALSVRHRVSSRKLAFGGVGAVLLLVAVPVAFLTGNHRTAQSIESSDSERNAMKDAARMMIADHPLGVGANQYVVIANTGGYSQRAGVAWNPDSRLAPVHDVYYLVAAEMGLLGLLGFGATILSFVLLGFRMLRRQSEDESDALAPGLLATMILVSVHISFEWVFMHFVLHYLFAIAAGLLVGIAARTEMRAKRRSTPARINVPAAAV